jgi:hypothetical protein
MPTPIRPASARSSATRLAAPWKSRTPGTVARALAHAHGRTQRGQGDDFSAVRLRARTDMIFTAVPRAAGVVVFVPTVQDLPPGQRGPGSLLCFPTVISSPARGAGAGDLARQPGTIPLPHRRRLTTGFATRDAESGRQKVTNLSLEWRRLLRRRCMHVIPGIYLRTKEPKCAHPSLDIYLATSLLKQRPQRAIHPP